MSSGKYNGNGRARGLAAMSPERRKEIASMGGRTSQARGTAHQWTAAEALQRVRKAARATRKNTLRSSKLRASAKFRGR